MTMTAFIDAIVLAGDRPGGDALAAHIGMDHKALVPVAGQPMLAYPLRVLLDHPAIRTVFVMAQDPGALLADPALAPYAAHAKIRLSPSLSGISESLEHFLRDDRLTGHVLVTTADNVLLNQAMIDHFLGETASQQPDVAVAMVERAVLMAAYPHGRRTWLKARGGAWSGANLFWLQRSPAVAGLLQFWQSIERDRKRGIKIVSAFGPVLLIGAVCRLVSMPAAIRRAGRRFALKARLVAMPMAEACIDVDKPDDLVLVESILAHQSAVRG